MLIRFVYITYDFDKLLLYWFNFVFQCSEAVPVSLYLATFFNGHTSLLNIVLIYLLTSYLNLMAFDTQWHDDV